ncbi:MAG: MBL fold metallo-hydrolase [Chloroflexi bacterium]|nr:MBL fold metallo-hydrolase [Chloroflexota bacterium]
MATTIHFIDVGQGNMVLVQCSDGTNFVVDCNITDANKDRVLNYVAKQIGKAGRLHAFICTHRDADHMRGVRALHTRFPIGSVWDSGYPGTTTDSDEYQAYMQLRRDLGSKVIDKKTKHDYGYTRLRYFSAKDDRLPKNANDQGIVVKVEELNLAKSKALSSTILTGDGSYATWKDGIMKDYSKDDVSCSILMAAHHGSLDFFDDPNDSRHYYTSHIKAIEPAMVVVSVGDNNFGHPDSKALELYRKYATGSDKGNKVFRTDRQHSMKLVLKSGGGWNLSSNQ